MDLATHRDANEARRTFVAGAIGAAGMSATAWVARRAGLRVDLEMLMGTMLGPPPGPRARVLGQGAQLAMGGLLAFGHLWVYRTLNIPATPAAGAAVGLAHGLVSGAALAAAPLVHPQIPERVRAPGPFMLREGRSEAAVFVLLHILFGATVSSLIHNRRN